MTIFLQDGTLRYCYMSKWQDRLDERRMALVRRLLLVLSTAILFLLVLRATIVWSQTVDELQPGFGQALSSVRSAQMAGGTPNEIAPLVSLLNKALELNDQAANSDSQTRSQLQTQISQQLATIETQAGQLESIASQRTFTNNVISYLSGGVGALMATLAYAYGLSFWRKYRVKRTFQMRISKK